MNITWRVKACLKIIMIYNESVEYESETRRYPRRERNPLEYLGQHEVNAQNNDIDHCYKVCGMPQNYTEAMGSPKARDWEQV